MNISNLGLPWSKSNLDGTPTIINKHGHIITLGDSATLIAISEMVNDYHMMFERHKAAQIKIVELMKEIEQCQKNK